jgi:hypothetical protein
METKQQIFKRADDDYKRTKIDHVVYAIEDDTIQVYRPKTGIGTGCKLDNLQNLKVAFACVNALLK